MFSIRHDVEKGGYIVACSQKSNKTKHAVYHFYVDGKLVQQSASNSLDAGSAHTGQRLYAKVMVSGTNRPQVSYITNVLELGGQKESVAKGSMGAIGGGLTQDPLLPEVIDSVVVDVKTIGAKETPMCDAGATRDSLQEGPPPSTFIPAVESPENPTESRAIAQWPAEPAVALENAKNMDGTTRLDSQILTLGHEQLELQLSGCEPREQVPLAHWRPQLDDAWEPANVCPGEPMENSEYVARKYRPALSQSLSLRPDGAQLKNMDRIAKLLLLRGFDVNRDEKPISFLGKPDGETYQLFRRWPAQATGRRYTVKIASNITDLQRVRLVQVLNYDRLSATFALSDAAVTVGQRNSPSGEGKLEYTFTLRPGENDANRHLFLKVYLDQQIYQLMQVANGPVTKPTAMETLSCDNGVSEEVEDEEEEEGEEDGVRCYFVTCGSKKNQVVALEAVALYNKDENTLTFNAADDAGEETRTIFKNLTVVPRLLHEDECGHTLLQQLSNESINFGLLQQVQRNALGLDKKASYGFMPELSAIQWAYDNVRQNLRHLLVPNQVYEDFLIEKVPCGTYIVRNAQKQRLYRDNLTQTLLDELLRQQVVEEFEGVTGQSRHEVLRTAALRKELEENSSLNEDDIDELERKIAENEVKPPQYVRQSKPMREISYLSGYSLQQGGTAYLVLFNERGQFNAFSAICRQVAMSGRAERGKLHPLVRNVYQYTKSLECSRIQYLESVERGYHAAHCFVSVSDPGNVLLETLYVPQSGYDGFRETHPLLYRWFNVTLHTYNANFTLLRSEPVSTITPPTCHTVKLDQERRYRIVGNTILTQITLGGRVTTAFDRRWDRIYDGVVAEKPLLYGKKHTVVDEYLAVYFQPRKNALGAMIISPVSDVTVIMLRPGKQQGESPERIEKRRTRLGKPVVRITDFQGVSVSKMDIMNRAVNIRWERPKGRVMCFSIQLATIDEAEEVYNTIRGLANSAEAQRLKVVQE